MRDKAVREEIFERQQSRIKKRNMASRAVKEETQKMQLSGRKQERHSCQGENKRDTATRQEVREIQLSGGEQERQTCQGRSKRDTVVRARRSCWGRNN
jgi:hypothetical protein